MMRRTCCCSLPMLQPDCEGDFTLANMPTWASTREDYMTDITLITKWAGDSWEHCDRAADIREAAAMECQAYIGKDIAKCRTGSGVVTMTSAPGCIRGCPTMALPRPGWTKWRPRSMAANERALFL